MLYSDVLNPRDGFYEGRTENVVKYYDVKGTNKKFTTSMLTRYIQTSVSLADFM